MTAAARRGLPGQYCITSGSEASVRSRFDHHESRAVPGIIASRTPIVQRLFKGSSWMKNVLAV